MKLYKVKIYMDLYDIFKKKILIFFNQEYFIFFMYTCKMYKLWNERISKKCAHDLLTDGLIDREAPLLKMNKPPPSLPCTLCSVANIYLLQQAILEQKKAN